MTDDQSALDPTVDLSGLGIAMAPAIQIEMLALFSTAMDELLAGLQAGGQSPAQVADSCHRLKSEAATLGAARLARLATAAEAEARKGQVVALQPLLEQAEFTRQSIDQLMAQLEGEDS